MRAFPIGLASMVLAVGAIIGGYALWPHWQVRNEVRQSLVDPWSARFRDVEIFDRERLSACGEVNGKNRLGAYVGFRPFLFDWVSLRVAEHGMENDVSQCCNAMRSRAQGHTPDDSDVTACRELQVLTFF